MKNVRNKLIKGDCLEVLSQLPNNIFDLIVIDPPFLIANYYALRTHMRKSFGDMGIIDFFFKNVFEQIEKVIKDTGFFYVFCNGDSYPLFWYYSFPFTKKVRPIIWNKKTSINGYSWRHQHELILFGEMPNSPKIKTGDGDIIECRAVPVKERKHPAEKPIKLLKRLILKSSNEGDLIADFFMGSGSTLLAAKQLNRKYFGVEYDTNYYELACRNIEENVNKNLEEWIK